MASPSIPREEYAQRRDALRADARDAGLDGLLAWSTGGGTLDRFASVFYLANHYQPQVMSPDGPFWTGFAQAAVVLPLDAPAVLVVDQPDWRTDLVEIDEVRVSRDVYAGVAAALRDAGLGRGCVGLTDEGRMGVAALRALESALPDATFPRADEIMMRRRVRKSLAELDMLRHASAVSVEIMNAMLGEAAEGRTDADLVAAGYRAACRLGAQPYDFAMASGPEDGHLWWARLPSWNWRRPYERGDIVHPDIYGAVDGYFYDFVRSTVVGGSPTPAQLEILEAGVGCIAAACDAARAGARARDVFEAGEGFLHDRGLTGEQQAPDGQPDLTTDELAVIGHGIGLGWEEPWLAPMVDDVLEPGMVLAIERHVTRRGVGTMRHEDVLIVSDGEPEILTRACPARWW